MRQLGLEVEMSQPRLEVC